MVATIFDYSTVNKFLSSRFPGHAISFLHGSRAKGIARPDSDVDLIVVFDNDAVLPSREIISSRCLPPRTIAAGQRLSAKRLTLCWRRQATSSRWSSRGGARVSEPAADRAFYTSSRDLSELMRR
ncbi:MAG: nucleotidyltransferase domain-containing protein [Massilia sp.]